VPIVYGPYPAPPGVNYAGVYGGLLSGSHAYVITATDSLGKSSQYTGTFDVAGPTISMVVVAQPQKVITWNVVDPDGVASSSLKVDGVNVTKIYGPYPAPPGVNYAGVYGSLPLGSHTYVITATDNAGNWSQYTGTFVLAGPTISQVVVDVAQGVITWNAADPEGVTFASLAIDGGVVPTVYGPYPAPTGVNYSGVYGALSSGDHTYVISAVDGAGNTSQYTGTLNTGSTGVGPTISQVVVDQTQKVITWNAASASGVASVALAVDSTAMHTIYGPYPTGAGANFSGLFNELSSGSHTYVISATDKAGNSSQYNGTLMVGPTIGAVVVDSTHGAITWHVAAAVGVKNSHLAIDDTNVSIVYPYPVADGVNFAGVYGSLLAGSHTYVITATDNDGNTSQYSGTTAVGAIISGVTVDLTQQVITWNALAAAGVASTSLTIDGSNVSNILGPYTADSGVNFAGVFGVLPIGNHTYVITVVDNAGISSQNTGTLIIPG
jgi:hypothetical protein